MRKCVAEAGQHRPRGGKAVYALSMRHVLWPDDILPNTILASSAEGWRRIFELREDPDGVPDFSGAAALDAVSAALVHNRTGKWLDSIILLANVERHISPAVRALLRIGDLTNPTVQEIAR